MNLDALWHDLECHGYREDLPLWRTLAAETGGPVLDVGAGTGRVTIDLAASGVHVVAVDIDAALLEALDHRAAGLSVETVVADARQFAVGRRVSLVLVPMQTLQLLGGARGRAAFLRRALAHLEPGGLLAAALGDAVECFDEEHDAPPPPDACEIAGVRYASQLLAVVDEGDRAAIHRRREITGPGGAANLTMSWSSWTESPRMRSRRKPVNSASSPNRTATYPRPSSTSDRRSSSSARRATQTLCGCRASSEWS